MTITTNDDWQLQANCIGVNPDIFFPDRGESLEPAKSVCSDCKVRDHCLEYAIAGREKAGVWGGTSERERRRIIRRRQTQATHTPKAES